MTEVAEAPANAVPDTQQQGAWILAYGSLALVPVSVLAAWMSGTPVLLIAMVASGFAALAVLSARYSSVHARIFVA